MYVVSALLLPLLADERFIAQLTVQTQKITALSFGAGAAC